MLKPFETHLIQIGSFLPIFAGLKLPPTVACGSEVSWEAEIGEPNSLNLRRFGLPSCTAKSKRMRLHFRSALRVRHNLMHNIDDTSWEKNPFAIMCVFHSLWCRLIHVWKTKMSDMMYIYKYIYTYKYCIQLDGKSPRPTEKLQINYCRKPKDFWGVTSPK